MADAYRVKRKDVFLGKKLNYGESSTNTFVRLAKRETGEWKRPVHEVWETKGKVDMLETPIDHISAKTVTEFVSKINTYTTINAEYLKSQGVKSSFMTILAYPVGKFLKNYIVKQGFRDGTHGFVHAVFMSFHSFLTRAKLYLLLHYKPIS